MPTDTAAPAVRAKFHCHSVRTTEGQKTFQGPMTDPTTEVHMSAVYGDGTDNAAWSKATPQGFVKMLVTNPDAATAFVAGQDYYIDFTPVPAAPAVTSLPVIDEHGQDDELKVGDVVQVPGLDGDHVVDNLYADGTIGLTPVPEIPAPAAPETPAAAPPPRARPGPGRLTRRP